MPDEINEPNEPLWPAVDTIPSAKRASMFGVAAAGLEALYSAFVALDPLIPGSVKAGSVDPWMLTAAMLMAVVAVGIYRESRFAVVAGLLLFILSRAAALVAASVFSPLTALLIFAILLGYIHAMRGVFALHALRRGG
ncbi:MAG: hypothetical protein KC731_38750 [Myxococcales bacterium]|nr:hypothetical protein [Myxococcales bacterium]